MELGIVLPPQLPKCWKLRDQWDTWVQEQTCLGACVLELQDGMPFREGLNQMLYQDRGLRDEAIAQLVDH